MSQQTPTIKIPDSLFQSLKKRAERTKRSVEDETLEVLVTAIPAGEELPPDLAASSSQLALLGDDDLWKTARNHLGPDLSSELELLDIKRQRESLSEAEEEKRVELLAQYERHLLIRAQASALLKQRGHDVSILVNQA